MISTRDKKIEDLTKKNSSASQTNQSNFIKWYSNYTKTDFTGKQEFQQLISNQADEIQRLNSQVDYLRRELQNVGVERTSEINQDNQLPHQNIDTPDYNVKSSKNAKQQDEIKALKTEITNLKKMISQKETYINELKQDSINKAKQNDKIINNYKLQLAEKDKKYLQISQLYEKEKINISVKEQTIQVLAKEKETFLNQNKINEQQISTLRANIANMTNGYERMKNENTYIRSEYEKIKGAANQYSALQSENTTIKSENITLKSENTTLKSENTALNSENSGLKREITTLKSENSALKWENDKVKKEAKKFDEKAKKERINKKRQKNQTENKKSKNIEIITSDTIQNIERLEEINFGGSGKVSKVALKTIYALKEMKSNISEKDFQNFILEYELMHNFDHPNIIKAFGIFMSDKKYPPSILLEFCPSNLDEAISKHSLSKVQIVFSIYQIIEGMKYIHFNRVVHRDLKPSNILIASDGTIRVSDFGISKLVGPGEQLATFGAGTQKFMAPELLNEIEYDEKVDVYSFGVLLYYILNNGIMPEITIVRIGLGEKADIPTTFTEFSQQLISDCWNKEPKDRPSFDQILNDLENNDFNLIDLNEEEENEVKSMINSHKAIIPDYSQ